MSIENKLQLKSYFEKGDKPTQIQFEHLIDSFRHIEDGATLASLVTNQDGNFTFEFSNGQKVEVLEAGALKDIANRLINNLDIEDGYVKYKNSQGDIITQISVDQFASNISESDVFKTAVENLIPNSRPIAYVLGLQNALDQRVTIEQLNQAISTSAYGIKYSWPTANDRNAETGMKQYEQGVQQDTREVYRYDGSSWVLFYTLDAVHNHDDRYYSKSESDAKFITEKREVSDLLTSTSTVIAASSKALKTVNDKVNNKLDKDDKAVDSDKLDGKDSSAFALSNHHHDDRYKRQYTQSFIIEGDADKYYQVVFKRGNQNRIRELNIYRSYHEKAPASWNTATHKGGLTAEFRLNSGGWGGAQYDWKLLDLRESYTSILADAGNTNHNMAFFVMLRGGGAIYHVDSDDMLDIQIVYNSSEITYNHTITSYIVYGRNPVSSINTINLRNHTIPTLRDVIANTGKAPDSDKLDGYDSTAFFRDSGDNIGKWRIASKTKDSAYTHASLEVREFNKGGSQSGANSEAPRISFHWGGRVASQLMLTTDGHIAVMNNPGTGYQNFRAATIFSNDAEVATKSWSNGAFLGKTSKASDSDKLDGLQGQSYTFFQSHSDFKDGTLVNTNINANVTNGESFVMEITGKSYSSGNAPFKVVLQGYIYNNTFINVSGLTYGGKFPEAIVVLKNSSGKLAFWWPRYSYWNNFNVKVTARNGKSSIEKNVVVDIINTAEPASNKKVKCTLIKAWNSSNDGSGSGLDADKLDGLDSSAFVRKNVDTNNSFHGQYLIFNHTSNSNVDAISFNDTTNDFFFNADRTKVNSSANAGVFASRFCITDKNTKLSKGSANSLKITNPSGYLDIGPKNTSHCHFYTDRSNFYFNKSLNIDSGVIRSYNEDLNLNRAGSATARMIIANGITYSDQSLGFRNGGRVRRYSHVGGFLEGSYNTVGANATKTNPIYTIGSSYIPSESALGNMYGIGYSHSSASFLNAADLGVNPHSSWGLYVSADGNARVYLNATHGHGYFKGDLYANKGIFKGDITASSDKRLKIDIEKIENAVDKILQINGCTWVRKDSGERQTGLIAQELQKVLPEAVHGEENDTEYLSIAYGNVVGLLVEGIKEQTTRMNALEERLEKLEALLTSKN